MNDYNTNYQQGYGYNQNQANQPMGNELTEGMQLSAMDLGDYDQGYILCSPGKYDFTVVNIETSRYQPGANSKIGPCKQITLTLRVIDKVTSKNVDLRHNLYMYNSPGCVGMIAQFYDSVGLHKKGEAIVFDWRPEVIIGKTGKLELTNKPSRDGQSQYNNIKKMLPLEVMPTIGNPTPNAGNWSNGRF